MCQGCQHTLRLVDGTVPPSPNDLTIARAEIRHGPYRDSSENLITSCKESAVHYHCHIWCIITAIKEAEPLFVPLLRVPVDINFTISSHRYIGIICEGDI